MKNARHSNPVNRGGNDEQGLKKNRFEKKDHGFYCFFGLFVLFFSFY